jgi:serine/threonine protein kinase
VDRRAVGRGAYGEVFQARCKRTNRLVALKKLLMVSPERDGFPILNLREINLLKKMKGHKNIVELIEVVTCGARRGGSSSPGDEDESGDSSGIYMVFEYLEHDMEGLLIASKSDLNVKITPHHVRSWSHQILEGIAHLHKNKIMHRDLKGGNILVGADNRVKIADFGMTRPLSDITAKYTPNLITLGFRPPELLMGMVKYGTSADMWSVGAIIAHLLLKEQLFPVFRGQTEIDHLHSIFKMCGTPKLSSDDAPGLALNPEYRYDFWPTVVKDCPEYMLKYQAPLPMPRLLQLKFGGNAHEMVRGGIATTRIGKSGISAHAVDLVEKLLHLDPGKRFSASQALDHDYFFQPGEEVPTPER